MLNLKDLPSAEPGIGHNSETPAAPTDWSELLDVEALKLALKMDHEALLIRLNALESAHKKFIAKYSDAGGKLALSTDDDVATATDHGAQVKAFRKRVEDKRVEVKRPFMDADKAVQHFFKGILDPSDKIVTQIEGAISAYQHQRAVEARRRQQEEAETKRQEAERLAAAAQATQHAEIFDEAVAAGEQADAAAKAAAAPIADFSRTRGDYAVSSGRLTYEVKVVDIALVPREYLMFDESKAKAAVNAKVNRVTEIPGCEVVEVFKTQIRS